MKAKRRWYTVPHSFTGFIFNEGNTYEEPNWRDYQWDAILRLRKEIPTIKDWPMPPIFESEKQWMETATVQDLDMLLKEHRPELMPVFKIALEVYAFYTELVLNNINVDRVKAKNRLIRMRQNQPVKAKAA